MGKVRHKLKEIVAAVVRLRGPQLRPWIDTGRLKNEDARVLCPDGKTLIFYGHHYTPGSYLALKYPRTGDNGPTVKHIATVETTPEGVRCWVVGCGNLRTSTLAVHIDDILPVPPQGAAFMLYIAFDEEES